MYYDCFILTVFFQVQQLHFVSWPDHGVPLYPQNLVPFLTKILQIPLSSKSPIVVHCSAGVGRTGTILLCDICLRMAAREGFVDALKVLQQMRNQRPNMVDNAQQFKLAHIVILECTVGMNTTIPCDDIDDRVEELLSEGIENQMLYLEETQWQDQAMKMIGDVEETQLVVAEKNRFQHIIPGILSQFPF